MPPRAPQPRAPQPAGQRKPTSTSSFGVSKRESHDASGFYSRFTPPDLCSEDDVARYRALDKLIVGDSRHMEEVPESSVALVVTSPPYFAGKEYEESLGQDGVPATYLDYLDLLREVFAECVRKLEPGGRIAVNVANLGRRPYRSLSADVIGILQDDLRLLLRGEVIWIKQRGSTGSCAWGSFQKPNNPVLRDLTERVIVASKGRFDRAIPAKVRAGSDLPSCSSMTRDDFMENTLDLWEIPAESATRVGHPAPFPIELPARLIELYTYRDDLVLDPFVGSGSTAVAAVRTGRHYAGYDLDKSYVHLAETRVDKERSALAADGTDEARVQVSLPAVPGPAPDGETVYELAVREGWASTDLAHQTLRQCGFSQIREKVKLGAGVEVSFAATDSKNESWLFDVCGPLTSFRPGLKRTDVLWKALAKAAVLAEAVPDSRLVFLTTGVPSAGISASALKAVTGRDKPVRAVVVLGSPGDVERLRSIARGRDL